MVIEFWGVGRTGQVISDQMLADSFPSRLPVLPGHLPVLPSRLPLLLALLLSGCVPPLPTEADDSVPETETDTDTDTDSDTDTGDTDDSDDTSPLPDADEDGSPDDLDCDDGDPYINPEALEVCGNEVDEDCDTVVSGPCALAGTSSLADAIAIRGDLTNMYLGASLNAADDDGDGFSDIFLGSSGTGEVYFFKGPTTGDLDAGDADASVAGEAGSYAGAATALVDLDGDGAADLVVGETGINTSLGGLLAFRGPMVGQRQADDADWVWEAESGASWGVSLAKAGDVDGDGLTDVALGANSGGEIQVLGSDSGVLAVRSTLRSTEADDHAGLALDSGDFDGDGITDLLIGAPYHGATPGYPEGAAYLVAGPLASEESLDDATLTFATEDLAGLGGSVANAGDTDGDGKDDMLVGAEYTFADGNYSGCAYLILGGTTGTLIPERADATLLAEAIGDSAGSSVSSAGDVDGDTRPDLLIGASGAGGGYGAAYLALSPVSGIISLADVQAKLTGTALYDFAGASVHPAGDNNADGYGDFLVGSYTSSGLASYGGAAYLLLGG